MPGDFTGITSIYGEPIVFVAIFDDKTRTSLAGDDIFCGYTGSKLDGKRLGEVNIDSFRSTRACQNVATCHVVSVTQGAKRLIFLMMPLGTPIAQ
jgi:hypothetical protein